MSTTILALFVLALLLIGVLAPFGTLALLMTVVFLSATVWILWVLLQSLSSGQPAQEAVKPDHSSD